MGFKSIPCNSYTLTTLGSLFFLSGLMGCYQTGSDLQKLLYQVDTVTPPKGVTVNFCTDPPIPQKFNLKMIIVLDHSTSNKMNYLMASDGSGAPAVINGKLVVKDELGTDPYGIIRYGNAATPGTLLNYLANTPKNDPANPTRFYSLVNFSTSTTSYPRNGAFTSDTEDFYRYVQADATSSTSTITGNAPTDAGATNYLSALDVAQGMITADIATARACAKAAPGTAASPGCPVPGVQVTSSYVVVFMSDGSPILSIDNVQTDSNGNTIATGVPTPVKQDTNTILSRVSGLAALASETDVVAGVNFFTVYYYYPGGSNYPANIDSSAQTLLANMAKVGNGVSYNAYQGLNIDYSKFTPPTKLINFTLSEVLLTNSSTTWWKDGKLYADTDMDGLPDDIESAWGSDPNNAYTSTNGISDLVNYQLGNAAPCLHKNSSGICMDSLVDYSVSGAACAQVSKSVSSAGKIVYRASDPNGLNDCEKNLLGDTLGIDNPDSNGDLIPDFLEFKAGVPFQYGTPSAASSNSDSGYTLYQKIKYSLPTGVPLAQILNVKPVDYDLQKVSTNEASQDCYQLSVDNLPTVGDNNTVRVDIIMKSDLVLDQYLYRVGKKAFPKGSELLQMNDWNDAQEKQLGTWSVWQ